MTLYVIPDLVWYTVDHISVARPSLTFSATITHYPLAAKPRRRFHLTCTPPAPPPIHWDIDEDCYTTLELAQAAANDWYKAKMAEGLKVATVEELRAAIKEMEQGQ